MISKSFGISALLLASTNAMALKSAFRPPEGSAPWHEPPSPPDAEDKNFPRHYFVPHFGEDRDITSTKNHIEQAEKNLKHEMELKEEKPIKRDYFVPHFGYDHDIVDSLRHTAQQEALHGKWEPVLDENGFWHVPTIGKQGVTM